MKFKINLVPYPAEAYFTVREHKTKFDSSGKAGNLLREVEYKLRVLFHISDDQQFSVLSNVQREEMAKNIKPSTVLDDPTSGTRLDLNLEENTSTPGMLDLSYSFPYIPESVGEYNHLLIDPSASLGVPCDFMYIFSTSDLPMELRHLELDSAQNAIDLFVLLGVLQDLTDKGSDVLLREANYKAAVLYQLIESHSELSPATEKLERSKTCVSAICDASFRLKIEKLGYEFLVNNIGNKEQITIANFPTHSKESIEMFADRVAVI